MSTSASNEKARVIEGNNADEFLPICIRAVKSRNIQYNINYTVVHLKNDVISNYKTNVEVKSMAVTKE